jgi:tRNA(fMet)-specific endonuclease VapC
MKATTEECVATVISYEEQCRGWLASIAKAGRLSEQIIGYRKLLLQLRNYCAIRVMEFDERAAAEFQFLKKGKLRIGTMDLKIASITLASNATLLTRNSRDFRKVPGLKIDDWTNDIV